MAGAWRFWSLAGLGLVWVVAWLYFVTDLPKQNRRVGAGEIELVTDSRAATISDRGQTGLAAAGLSRPCSTLSLGLGMFAVNYTL